MSTAAEVIQALGGREVVHQGVTTGLDLVQLVRRGLPVEAVDRLMATFGVTGEELDRVVIPRKTLYHRRKIGTLSTEQSERVLRVARVLTIATETFGSAGKAMQWVRRRTRPLGGEAPLTLLDTEEGAHLVENLLGRIAHGIAA